jgi:hypothetical protein
MLCGNVDYFGPVLQKAIDIRLNGCRTTSSASLGHQSVIKPCNELYATYPLLYRNNAVGFRVRH